MEPSWWVSVGLYLCVHVSSLEHLWQVALVNFLGIFTLFPLFLCLTLNYLYTKSSAQIFLLFSMPEFLMTLAVLTESRLINRTNVVAQQLKLLLGEAISHSQIGAPDIISLLSFSLN